MTSLLESATLTGMKKNARDNLAKFFYDAAKLSLAILVFGVLARQPIPWIALIVGVILTLLFIGFGVIFDFVPVQEEK